MPPWFIAALSILAGSVPWATPERFPVVSEGRVCAGDCDGDGVTTVAELVTGVNMVLGRTATGACNRFDGNGDLSVTVDELSVAINAALHGCLPEPATPSGVSTRPPARTTAAVRGSAREATRSHSAKSAAVLA